MKNVSKSHAPSLHSLILYRLEVKTRVSQIVCGREVVTRCTEAVTSYDEYRPRLARLTKVIDFTPVTNVASQIHVAYGLARDQ